ncbi:flagellar export chaperone FliS [Alicyclobacillus dauci]|uniref:Flagellar secretion chaperone FliS n=1 Tax=Alicyclobacillus dauci TaxID=1475485 RepID=A0ABY6Z4K4_9BACL|nr:flagellar export chaperone FliS [Alicyclobacillus dauci]WAH37690.1 flagellar export chaperone FliS [Alicyclobacillus dauci]
MSFANRASSMYRNYSVQTASQPKLVVMLYDGWLSALSIAKQAIMDKKVELAHCQLTKAQSIVQLLSGTLDMQYEISKQLEALYDFFYRQLVQANIEKSTVIIDEQISIVKELRDGWDEAVKQLADPTIGGVV